MGVCFASVTEKELTAVLVRGTWGTSANCAPDLSSARLSNLVSHGTFLLPQHSGLAEPPAAPHDAYWSMYQCLFFLFKETPSSDFAGFEGI